MTLFPLLPFCRQSLSARRKLLEELRSLIKNVRQAQEDIPRFRIRSLDVIPLAFSLPRYTSLCSITHHIDPQASIEVWSGLQFGMHFTTNLLNTLFKFFAASNTAAIPRFPPLMTWNPSSLKTIHSQPSPKLTHILQLARTHICHLQETQWTSLQYKHLHQQAPFCSIIHAPCIDHYSSGVATFIPHPLISTSHSIIVPGFILSVITSISGVQCELINIYLRPDKLVLLGQKLLAHLQSAPSRQYPLRIIGGDFNQLQSKSSTLFDSILNELNCSPPHDIPSFRRLDGYSSSLDFFLSQVPSHTSHHLTAKSFSFWPSYQPTGHGIHICRFRTNPHIASSPDDLPAQAIPTSAFYRPPSQLTHSSSASPPPSLQPLIRSLLSLSTPSLLPVKTTIWAWWRTLTKPITPRLTDHHHHTLLKLLSRAHSTLLPAPISSWHWLLSNFPTYEPPVLSVIHDNRILIPVHLLSTLLTRFDILNTHRPSFNITTQFSSPSTRTWQKCRFAAPKVAQHHGAIRSSSGELCTTTKTLDQALRATRSFWSQPPSPFHPDWTVLLKDYALTSAHFPSCNAPNYDDFYHSVITSPDSAPGADGLPYSAWRVCPPVSAACLAGHFDNIITSQASPPLQSLVFIPKADAGEYADNYRPLGLPNTCDRIVDRAAYAKFCAILIGFLHPAQALLNTFREPQFNYLEIQNLLDSPLHRSSVLLSDLAKAFERVNPHWIMHVLFARRAPFWVLSYCRHILFGRRVLHKIRSSFRPPLALHNGVDMGRAFSVLLFCVAMDPWYHQVHKIPHVLVNRGYMDDNATGGRGLLWLMRAEQLIESFASAGFVVLKHYCYSVDFLDTAPLGTPFVAECPPVTNGSPSLLPLLPSPLPPSYLRLCCGSRALTIHSSLLTIGPGLSCPTHPHLLSYLHSSPCSCKCKTFLLPNFLLSHEDLVQLDRTPFGAKIVTSHATMLGFFLHSPIVQVAPNLNASAETLVSYTKYKLSDIEHSQMRKSISTMERRAKAVTALSLSFRERTIFLSFYVLSIPLYLHSTLLPTTAVLQHYTRIIRKVLCPRPWVQAEHLPGIVRYLKLGTLHCPKISLFASLLGYCVRCYGEPIATWLCFISQTLPSMPEQLRQGLLQIRSALVAGNPYTLSSFTEPFQKHIYTNLPPHKLAKKLTSALKEHLLQQLSFDTRAFLRLRVSQVPWLFSSGPPLLDVLHTTPLKAIPCHARLAIFRWLIDSEPDLHFRLRPFLSRSSPCICGCGLLSSIYPFGLPRGAFHSSHLHFDLLYTLAFSSLPDDSLSPQPTFNHPPLPPPSHPPLWTLRTSETTDSLAFLPPALSHWCSLPCVLCGTGDNSVQHWLLFCPILALAGSLLLKQPWKTRFWFLSPDASLQRRAIIGGLWVASRQFVHERSGLPPPSLAPPPATTTPLSQLPHLLALRAASIVPPFFRPSHLAIQPPPLLSTSCSFLTFSFPTLTLEQEGLPHFYGPAPALTTACLADAVLGVFPTSSPLIKQLFQFQRSYPQPPNCTLAFKPCSCGCIHGYLTALLPLPKGTPLHIGDPPTNLSDFVIQFDGGAYRELKLGGAGVILWQHAHGSLEPIDSLCIPIYPCADAAHAEACGAAHAVLLAAKHYTRYQPSKILIKGDNRTVIDFMTHKGKFRRSDLQQLLEESQHVLAFALPPVLWSYTPREFNRCADYLAGVARDHVKEHFTQSSKTLCDLLPFFFPLPPSLLSQFSSLPILRLPSSVPTLTLPEIPSLPMKFSSPLFRFYQHSPKVLRYLRATYSLRTSSLQGLSVHYRPSASDHIGRLYPTHLGAAKLPKPLRLLLFGSTHHEIDLVGSHYQIFQKFHAKFFSNILPTVQHLRTLLYEDMVTPPCPLLHLRPKAPKDLPTHLLNTTLEATVNAYQQFGYYPSPQVLHTLRAINRAKNPVFERLEQLFGPRTLNSLTSSNRPFHTLEHPETLWLRSFTEYICAHTPIDSIIWLHDGIWISPLPSPTLLVAANTHASSRIGVSPLSYTVTSLLRPHQTLAAAYLHNGSLPPDDPPTTVRPPPPALTPVLREQTARDAFMRMMARSAPPSDVIVIDE